MGLPNPQEQSDDNLDERSEEDVKLTTDRFELTLKEEGDLDLEGEANDLLYIGDDEGGLVADQEFLLSPVDDLSLDDDDLRLDQEFLLSPLKEEEPANALDDKRARQKIVTPAT